MNGFVKIATSAWLAAGACAVGTAASSAERTWRVRPGESLEEVRDEVRAFHRTHPGEMCRVVLASGRHERRTTFALGREDGDTTYAGEAGARVSGTQIVTGWTEGADAHGRFWTAVVPGLKEGKTVFNQLWVNGRRATVARWPKPQADWRYGTKRLDLLHPAATRQTVPTGGVAEVVLDLKKAFDRYPKATQFLTAHSNELDMVRTMSAAQVADISLVVNHNWDVTRRIVRRVDLTPTNVTLVAVGKPFKHWNPWRPESVYWLENVAAACTAPGDWFFDTAAGTVTYRPRPGERIETSVLEIPRTGFRQLAKVDGARNVAFENLTFEGTDIADQRQFEPCQAAASVGAAVETRQAANVVFRHCTFRGVGEYALWLRDGCTDCAVEACHVYDAGTGGVRLGDSGRHVRSQRLLLRDTLVEDVGLSNPCGVGVWIGEPQHSKVLHNHIRRTRYSGISIGWNWGYAGAGVSNELAYNLVEDVGLGGLTDEGAIYCLGKQDGTTIHDNVLRRVDGYTFCRWALYFDQGTTGVTAYNNLCYDAVDGGFNFHYGRDNVVSNNIFATGLANHMVNVGRAEKFKMIDFTRNIVWWDAKDAYWDVRDRTVAYRDYGRDREPGTMVFSSNVWWCANGEVLFRAGGFKDKTKEISRPLTFDEWRKAPFQAPDNDAGSVVEDPQFANPHKGDFRIRNTALLRRIGFVPWDMSTAGLSRGVRPGAWR